LAIVGLLLFGVQFLVRAAVPVILPQTFSVPENSGNGTHVGDVVASDDDLPSDTLTYTLVVGSAVFALDSNSGALTVSNSQMLDYETTPSFVLSVRVTDSEALSDTAPITVTLTNVNEPPIAEDAGFSVEENVPIGTLVGQVVAVDPEQAPNTLEYEITAGNDGQAFAFGASGALQVNNPAALDYEAQSVFHLTVRVRDSGGLTDTAGVTVNLLDANDPPVARDDTRQVVEDSDLNVIYVRANDTDQDQDPLRVVGVSEAQHGTPSVAPENLYVFYTPDEDYEGTDTFQYTIHDGRGGQATGTVTVTITGVNDPPTAVDNWASTPEDQPVQIDVAANDTDIDGHPDPTTVEIVIGPRSGTITNIHPDTGVITYRPNANWNGSDSFTYRIRDDGSPLPRRWSDPATVFITTDPVPDFPEADAGPDQIVFSNDLVTLDGSGSEDPDGGKLTYYWVYSGTIPISLSDPNAVRPTFTAPFTPTQLIFSLTVIDEDGWADTTPDTVEITVKSRPPAADAGPDLYVFTGDQVLLSGAGSTDGDGDTKLAYVWRQVEGPTVTLEPSASVELPTFTAPLSPTVLTFWLYVYDSFGTHDEELSRDEVRVVVRDPAINELHLPLVAKHSCDPGIENSKPELVVQSLTITADTVSAVMVNLGCAAPKDWFYVDAYINPTGPITIDDNWWKLNDSYGIKWQVTPSDDIDPTHLWPGHILRQLAPGESLYLDQSNMLTGDGYSRVPPEWSPGTEVWVQVDTYEGGRISELNEQNNLFGPRTCCP